jgi:hypothetical protein
MIIATVSGSASMIARSISSSSDVVSSSPCSGLRKELVFDTWVVSMAGRPNGSLKPGTPVNDSAPSVTPW